MFKIASSPRFLLSQESSGTPRNDTEVEMNLVVNRLTLGLIVLILGVGIYARFTQLAWHFSNVDDSGVAEVILKNRAAEHPRLFPISVDYTYAPFQFVFTPFLINAEQSYRDLLFFSRLPSCFFSIVALFALLFFYRRWDAQAWKKLSLLPLVLLACSWENIAHAKQAHNYALGVLAAIGVFSVVLANIKNLRFSFGRLTVMALLLALFSHMHYQVIILVMGVYATLGTQLVMKAEFRRWSNVWPLLVSGLLYAALIFPMLFFLLKPYLAANAGAPGTTLGENKEFLFQLPTVGFIDQLQYIFTYYAKNFYLIFRSNLAFIPENSGLLPPTIGGLFVLFAIGFFYPFFSRESWIRAWGWYCLWVAVLWMLLVALQKLNMSPTRHALILSPLMAIVVGQGVMFLVSLRAKRSNPNAEISSAVGLAMTVLLILVSFLLNFPQFLKDRRDPFVEEEIMAKLKEYKVDAVFTNWRTDNLKLMKTVQAFQREKDNTVTDVRRIAWVSRQDMQLSPSQCEILRQQYNMTILKGIARTGEKTPLITHACSEYKLLYRNVIPSTVQTDYTQQIKVHLYTNSMYFYVVGIE